MTESGYTPIEEYGVVGNLETCALVAPDGSVDWFPFPHVESPSILAAILDPERGGRFRIGPAGEYEATQQYVETTNVLETTFRTADGEATVRDFLPPAGEVDQPKKVIYRKVTCSEGRSISISSSSRSSTTDGRRRRLPRRTTASSWRATRSGRCSRARSTWRSTTVASPAS